jgi:hypothetical protein
MPPTAPPTIGPMWDFFSVDVEGSAVGFADGVTVTTMLTVATPAGPEETLTATEVNGVGDADALVPAALAEGRSDDADGVRVFEGPEPAVPEPSAKPVFCATDTTLDAWFLPIVA